MIPPMTLQERLHDHRRETSTVTMQRTHFWLNEWRRLAEDAMQRVGELEDVLRQLHAQNAQEVEQSIDARLIEKVLPDLKEAR